MKLLDWWHKRSRFFEGGCRINVLVLRMGTGRSGCKLGQMFLHVEVRRLSGDFAIVPSVQVMHE